MEFVVIWLVCAAVVAAMASSKGHSGIGWFLISVVISPLLGFIIVAMLRKEDATTVKAERTYFGIPYEERRDGTVFALIDGARVSFNSVRKFIVHMEEKRAAASNAIPPNFSDIADARETYLDTRFKRNWDSSISAFIAGQRIKFANYDAFIAAVKESRAIEIERANAKPSI